MADLVPVVTDVRQVSGSNVTGTAGGTITAGMAVILDPDDGLYYAADGLAASVAGNADLDNVIGIALSGASATQTLVVQTSGVVDIGVTTAVGTIYQLSNSAGGIMPAADALQDDWVTIIGVSTLDTQITLNINRSGVQVA